MKARRLPGIRRVFVGIGVVLLLVGLGGGAMIGNVAGALGLTAFALVFYSGCSFIIWRIIRGRALKTVDREIADVRELLHSYKYDLPLMEEIFETAKTAKENGSPVRAEELLSVAMELPDSEHPIRAFLASARQDDSAAADALSRDYLRELESAVDRLSNYIADDHEAIPTQLDRIYDNFVEQELALCHGLQDGLDGVTSAPDPETRADLWTDISAKVSLVADLYGLGLFPPPEDYPLQGSAHGYADAVVSASGCRSSATRIDPQYCSELVSTLETTVGRNRDEDLFRYASVYARTEALRADVDRAESLLDDGEGFESQEYFRDATRGLAEIRESAADFGFDTLTDEIDDLLTTSREGQKRAYRAASGGQPAGQGDPASTVSFDTQASATQSPGKQVTESLQAELPDHEIIEHLGSGGNADVHKVRLEESGEIAALKVPKWQGTLSQAVVEEFVDEARTWDQLDDHEHIITLRDFGINPYPWMLLEFMDRGNLATQLDSLSPARGVRAIIDVCDAAHYAHQHGVAHTDIKPENIMFTTTGDGVDVKVGDWGLAQVMLQHSKSVDGMTPSYAAPEQIDPDTYGSTGPKTDIYQLGVTTYEILTDRTPYDHDSAAAVMNAVVSKDYTPPSEHNDNLSPSVDEVMSKAMATDQADRYESVLYFRDALRELLS